MRNQYLGELLRATRCSECRVSLVWGECELLMRSALLPAFDLLPAWGSFCEVQPRSGPLECNRDVSPIGDLELSFLRFLQSGTLARNSRMGHSRSVM